LNNAGEKVVLSFPFLFLSVLFIPRTHQGTKFPTQKEEKKYKKVDLISSTGRQYQEKSHR